MNAVTYIPNDGILDADLPRPVMLLPGEETVTDQWLNNQIGIQAQNEFDDRP